MRILLLILILSEPLYAAAIRHTTHNFIFDTSTTLMWQDENITSTDNWEDAISVCRNYSLGGYTDWRLPNINELQSIVDYTNYNPAVREDVFQSGNSNVIYWSSTTKVDESDNAWLVDFKDGSPVQRAKAAGNPHYIRCVRGGE